MIPSALCSQLEKGLGDFLRLSFWSSTPGMEGVIDRFVAQPGTLLKGPYVTLNLPFQPGSRGEWFRDVPLGFPAHRHQELAFARLSGAAPKNTLVATGTGSGKTECFLIPILDYCLKNAGTPGIKAILIYPMNALATDQAQRIAKRIHDSDRMRGAVRAGLYIGESPGEKRAQHKLMGPEHVITDRRAMHLNPPDILITNYKMLDYLLVRPGDQALWQPNLGSPLRFLVVDELHSFDGAQGTDLACLIRRLKSRLDIMPGSLCCVGTSATLGGGHVEATLRRYAEDIFGEPFEPQAVISEARQSLDDFLTGSGHDLIDMPDTLDPDVLDPARYAHPLDYVQAQYAVWFDEALPGEPGSDPWRVALSAQLRGHRLLHLIVPLAANGPMPMDELIALMSTWRLFRGRPELARQAIGAFLSLVSFARSWRAESDAARARREAAGEPPPTRPFLDVRVQLWARELGRMVATVAPQPELRFWDDLQAAEQQACLPMVHCRDCGALGWATLVRRDQPHLYRTSLDRFYRAFFANDPQVRFLWPETAAPADGGPAADSTWSAAPRFALHRHTLTRVHDEEHYEPEDLVRVVVSANLHSSGGAQVMHRDCPFCGAHDSLTLLGFRAATLTSVLIDQLFASGLNSDKKLLTFSDSVQDAAHRAGFFGARTWRFNLRVALQQTVRAIGEDIPLAELPAVFAAYWRSRMVNVTYAATFLAPNMAWFRDYEAMQQSGVLADDARLLRDIDRRIAFEIATEYSHQARIGRSLIRSGCSTVYVDAERLDAATNALLEPLRNRIGGLRALTRERLMGFLLGALHHLREQGGVDHAEVPRGYLDSAGENSFSFTRQKHLPSFSRTSRLPVFLTDRPQSPRFDVLTQRRGSGTWYQRWVDRCFGDLAPLIGEPWDIWMLVLPALVTHDLLTETQAARGSRVWGVAASALRISSRMARLECDRCGHWMYVALMEIERWQHVPCMSGSCCGSYPAARATSEGADRQHANEGVLDYFGRLYTCGEVVRVFTAEHTGLLDRPTREEVENRFKAIGQDRKPWFPNLLSCTPTLEMGIDIGDLSTGILCSVPPAQANYLQRIGRAGRRDGNSLVVTMALRKPHDLYFYANPVEMIAGEVNPPGVFLSASAVLERQLAAFTLDTWNKEIPAAEGIPRYLREVFEHLDDQALTRFPHNWLSFVDARQRELLDRFVGLFGDRISAPARTHLAEFLHGNRDSEGSLWWKVLDLLQGERKMRNELKHRAQSAHKAIKELRAQPVRSQAEDQRLADLEQEKRGLEALVRTIDKRQTLEFLTDQSLLPNYAFPEAPVSLRSVIWWRRREGSEGANEFETWAYEYVRPAMTAIAELAPENHFYAGGRHVTIDQVDMSSAERQVWRFCDQCTRDMHIGRDGDPYTSCPNCGSPAWGEDSQKRTLLRMRQVFATTEDRKSRIGDDQERRERRYYSVHMAFTPEQQGGAWRIDAPALPFAFEHVARATFRELNFGDGSQDGAELRIAGRSEAGQGFRLCRQCGKVQSERRKGRQRDIDEVAQAVHTAWCPVRKKAAAADDMYDAVYLYREFSSEALRLLLPLAEIGSNRQLSSLVAAFQLGLRDKYGGRLDHLQTLVYSDPEQGSHVRRQYLVLYDTVPGGTGYIEDLVRPGASGEMPLLDILERAYHRLSRCPCVAIPERDGCYRCLFRYRNSQEMPEISRNMAMELIGRILEHRDRLEPVDSLDTVSTSGLMDSVLEARFLEALRRLDSADRPVQLEKAIVRNRPGWRITVGTSVWNIEPQVALGQAQGFVSSVEIDFVLHPGPRTERDGRERRPVAVFLDGFEFHRNRIGKDMLQRMTLLASGAYEVWSFTWQDVEAVFVPHTDPPPFVAHPDRQILASRLVALGLGRFDRLLDAPLVQILVEHLQSDAEAIPWSRLAATVVMSQAGLPAPHTAQDELHAWHEDVRARVPAEVWPWFESVDTSWLRVHRPPGSSSARVGLWAAAPPEAVRAMVSGAGAAAGIYDELCVLAWLDDTPPDDDPNELRRAWHGYLRLFQLLGWLPNAWLSTAQGRDTVEMGALVHQRGAVVTGAASPWRELDVDSAFVPLVVQLEASGVSLPEVGLDLPDARGRTSGMVGELVWEDARVAVVKALMMEAGVRPVAKDWTVFALDQLLADCAPLLAALARFDGDV